MDERDTQQADGVAADAHEPDVDPAVDEEVGEAGTIADVEDAWWEEFRAGRLRKKSLRELPRLIGEALRIVLSAARAPFLISSVLQTIQGIAAGFLLLLAKDALESILGAQTAGVGFAEVIPKLVIVAVVTAVTKLIGVVQMYFTMKTSELTTRRAYERLLDVACIVPLESFDNPAFYDQLKRAEFSAQMRPMQMATGLTGTIGGVFGFAGISVGLLAIEPILLPLVIVAYVPVWLARARETKALYETELSLTAAYRERYYVQSVLMGRDEAKEVRAFGLARALRDRYDRLSDTVIRDRLAVRTKRLRRSLVAEMATIILGGGILGLVVWLVVSGRMELAAAGSAIAAVQMIGSRLQTMLGSITGLYETALFLEDYVSFLDLQPRVEAARPTDPAPESFRSIRVEGLSFAYPGSARRVLHDISLGIGAGEIIALVGENGSGKTTLAKLLAGLYAPTDGRILWDGVDIATVDPDQVRSNIALIFQDFVRYKLPARENIGVGRYERMDDMDAVRRAAQQAGADQFLRRLPHGYETILSKEFSEGRDLSIGQWQRVALARAFFRDAQLIILDEPTASLDPRAERALFDSIRSLAEGRTVLLISHRFSSVRSADKIFVLQAGSLVESGTHPELMAIDGLYAELFTLQASQYVDTARAD